VSHSPNQPSLQHGATKDINTNMSTPSSVINDDDEAYEFNRRKMGYAIFITNSDFDHQTTRLFADMDYGKMSKLFWNLGFEIKTLNNKTNADLKMCLAGM
jgi:hypothetical protein